MIKRNLKDKNKISIKLTDFFKRKYLKVVKWSKRYNGSWNLKLPCKLNYNPNKVKDRKIKYPHSPWNDPSIGNKDSKKQLLITIFIFSYFHLFYIFHTLF